MKSFIELVEFQLAEGVSDDNFLQHQDELNSFVKSQPGFYYRTLIKTEGGRYQDIVHWATESEAKSAAELFKQQLWAKQMIEQIDPETISIHHVPALSEIGYDAEG